MAAKKKAAAKKSSAKPAPSSATAAATSDEHPQSVLAEDPSLSSDGRFSTYKDNNKEFPPDTGNQMIQVLGKPDAKTEAL